MISMSVYSNNETYGRVTMNFGNEQRDRLGKERYQYNLCRKMGLYCQSFSQLMERRRFQLMRSTYVAEFRSGGCRPGMKFALFAIRQTA